MPFQWGRLSPGLTSLLVAVLLSASPADLQAASPPAIYPFPSHGGGSGLLDMPSARLLPDWTVRAGYTWADPYATYALSAALMPWLEVSGRLTEVSGLGTRFGAGYGDYKDKAIDVKVRLLEESGGHPAVAIGATDIHGTGLFTSRYLVLSRRLGALDLTLGAGQGILAGDQTKGAGSAGPASEDAAVDFLTSGETHTRLFGGAELHLTEELSAVGEYSSLEYETMFGLAQVSDPGSSPLNFGLRYRLTPHLLMSLTALRGERLGWSLAGIWPFEPEGMLPWKKQPYWVADEELRRRAASAGNDELALFIREEVVAEHFSNVQVAVSDRAVWLEIENPTYLSDVKAMGRAARATLSMLPERIEWLSVSLKTKNIILVTMTMGRQDFAAFLDNRLDAATLLTFSGLTTDGGEARRMFFWQEPSASPLTPEGGSSLLRYGVRPSWRTLLNDPSGFLKNNIGLVWHASLFPWTGVLGRLAVHTPLYNNVSTSNRVEEPNPSRTDFVSYMAQTDLRVETLAFDQVVDLPGHWLARGALGFFESAYGGFGAEIFRLAPSGRWGAGLESEWVWKRGLDREFHLQGAQDYRTLFCNLYGALLPAYGVDLGLKVGRFLAGDWGGRLDVSRTFRHFTVGVWYSITDTSGFVASYNRGYHDKGIYLTIPFSLFTDRDVPRKLSYSLRPWTRDPGQTVGQINALYPMANRGNPDTLSRHLDELRD
ncbi:MAG: YjbH domain-containing protein [Thermodesulfobacteriota bacterium]